MKKVLVFVIMTSCSCMIADNRSLEGLKHANINVYNSTAKNDQCIDEYEHVDEDNNLQEYEQHVCDHIKPPQVSAAMALLTEVGGRVLIEFITLREALRRYLVALKDVINKWFGYIVTQ